MRHVLKNIKNPQAHKFPYYAFKKTKNMVKHQYVFFVLLVGSSLTRSLPGAVTSAAYVGGAELVSGRVRPRRIIRICWICEDL